MWSTTIVNGHSNCYLWSDVLRESKEIRHSVDVNEVPEFQPGELRHSWRYSQDDVNGLRHCGRGRVHSRLGSCYYLSPYRNMIADPSFNWITYT